MDKKRNFRKKFTNFYKNYKSFSIRSI